MLDKSQPQGEVIADEKLDPQEIARFDRLADQWWDPEGKYKTALAFNAARLEVISRQIHAHFHIAPEQPLTSLSVLDVGCGGGLISEPLAAQGASVTGIDASAMSIQVATRHARHAGVEVDYRHCLLDALSPESRYDVVINAEVVEHVPNQPDLIAQCAARVKPGGMLILATLNRTWRSYVVAIVGAEYVMRYLPIGTHRWDWFVKPQELRAWLPDGQFEQQFLTGMSLNPLSGRWRLTRSVAVNYLMCLTRQA